jgi:predicted nucleic acid-binding protein
MDAQVSKLDELREWYAAKTKSTGGYGLTVAMRKLRAALASQPLWLATNTGSLRNGAAKQRAKARHLRKLQARDDVLRVSRKRGRERVKLQREAARRRATRSAIHG